MVMIPRYPCVLACAALAVIVLSSGLGFAKEPIPIDDRLPARQDYDSNNSRYFQDMKTGKIPVGGTYAQRNTAVLKATAEYYIYAVNEGSFYGHIGEEGQLIPRSPRQYLDAVFEDLQRSLLIPDATSRLTTDQFDFITQYGAALDDAVQVMIKSKNPLVRVNAARALAVAAQSGAVAHAKTITNFLDDPKTPPEILLYTYKAAGNFLSAYHPLAVRNEDQNRHSVPDEILVPLLTALEKHIIENPPVAEHVFVKKSIPAQAGAAEPAAGGEPAAAGDPNAAKPAAEDGKLEPMTLTSEQLAVVRYFRREAVKAFAKVRVDIAGGQRDLPEIRPAYTLARIATSDPTIVPAPGPTEVAEAITGLLRIMPSNRLNIDVLAQSIAAGLSTLAEFKKTDPGQGSGGEIISWKYYGARLADGFNTWRNSVNRSPRALASQTVIRSLADMAMSQVVDQLGKESSGALGVGIDANRITSWRTQNPPRNPNGSLFTDSPKYKIAGLPSGT